MIIILASLAFIRMMLSLILGGLILMVALKTSADSEKLSPFECGFRPKLNRRINFSLQFFLITLIFLIFDVELILMFPFLGHLFTNYSLMRVASLIFFIVVLSCGLF